MTRRIWLGLAAAPFVEPGRSAQALDVRLRSRQKLGIVEHSELWAPQETAILVCDMWNGHYCQNAFNRIEALVPSMNTMLNSARQLGVHIIHAPSGCMKAYDGTLQRKRMMQAKTFASVALGLLFRLNLSPAPPLPIDDITQPCDDDVVGPAVRRFDRQHPGIEIKEPDGISDEGSEIYNFFDQEGVRNVVIMGVHANMCILNRSFGIRQLLRLGKNVVLARDMTDAMYDPRQSPWVSHQLGTDLVINYIERHFCPSLNSRDLTNAIQNITTPARPATVVRSAVVDASAPGVRARSAHGEVFANVHSK